MQKAAEYAARSCDIYHAPKKFSMVQCCYNINNIKVG